MVFCLLLSLSHFTWAQNTPASPPDIIPAWKSRLDNRINSLANSLDSYFGDIRADDESHHSTVRISPGETIGEFNSPQSAVDIRANLRMTNLEKLGRDLERNIFGSNENHDEQEGETEAQKKYDEQWGWHRTIESRLIGAAPPAYGSLIRWRKNFQEDQIIHRYWASIGWLSNTLWEDNMNFSSDFEMSKSLLFRWFNQWTWNMSSSLQSTSHGPSIYDSISDRLKISYDFRINMAIENHAWVLDNYILSATLRRQMNRKWIFLEATPSISFGRIYGFDRDLAIFARVEFVFGGDI